MTGYFYCADDDLVAAIKPGEHLNPEHVGPNEDLSAGMCEIKQSAGKQSLLTRLMVGLP